MRTFFALLGLLLLWQQGQAQIILQLELHYKSGKTALTAEHFQELETAIAQLSNVPEAYYAVVEGHTDNMGDASFNQKISNERAANAAKWLSSKGFTIKEQAITGWASSKPKVSNSTWKGKSENRRVTISFAVVPLNVSEVLGKAIPDQVFAFDATKGGTFVTKGGIEIVIPENALVDANGNPITGKVDLSIREFNGKLDFLVGGVPMNYTPEGQDALFSSLGMLELNASQNGTQVDIAAGKKVDLNFTYGGNEAGVGLYRYDVNAGGWDEINNQGESLRDARAQRNNVSCPIGCSYGDVQGYATMLEMGHQYSIATPGNRPIDHYRKYLKADSVARIYSDSLSWFDEEILAAKSAWQEQAESYVFKASLRSKKYTSIALSTTNPRTEVKYIRSQRWNYYKKKNALPLDTLLDRSWADVELLYNEAKNEFRMALLGVDGYVDTILLENPRYLPPKKGKPLPESKKRTLDRMLSSYSSKRVDYGTRLRTAMGREDELMANRDACQRRAQKYINAADPTVLQQMRCFWLFSREFMEAEEELALCFEDWLVYFGEHRAMMQQRYRELDREPRIVAAQKEWKLEQKRHDGLVAMNETVQNTLSISDWGTYNCDKIERLEDPIIIAATYQTSTGNEVKPTYVYVFDENINGMLYYTEGYDHTPENFALDPSSTQLFFAFDAKGNAYYVEGKEFARLRGKKTKMKITLKRLKTDDTSTLDHLFADL